VPNSSPSDPRAAPVSPLHDPHVEVPAPRPASDSVPFALRLKSTRGSVPELLPDDAERCRIHGRWEQLIEILLLSLERAGEARERARLLLEIADVFRDELNDPSQALDAVLEAWRADPTHDAGVAPLEDLARAQSRWPEVVQATREMLAAEKSRERILVLCERMFWWLAFELGQADEAVYFVERLRAADSTHSVVHLYQALVHGTHGDRRSELHELDRATLSTRRPEDRARLLVRMAALYEDPRAPNPVEAKKTLAAAIQSDPRCVEALRALETIHEREDDAVSLAAVLDRHTTATRDVSERVDVLRRLADLYETRFLKPAVAAEKLSAAFSLDPYNVEVLGALERCYRATRAWPELASALELASLSEDAAIRDTSLASLAEVLDSRLNDPGGALKAYERLYASMPGNEEILGHLERLAEKVGDWQAAAAWRARHAEHAVSKEARARLHVAAGLLLAPPDREPLLARVHFEEAVACDPSNEAAWSALFREARTSGDAPRLARYLAERAEATDGPRQKGQLYVELAELRQGQLGDELGAIEAYVAASRADPTNEASARALLEIYVASQRWRDALPLFERVALAAERDGDTDLLAATLGLGRRIALAERDTPRALRLDVTRFGLRGDSRDVRENLVESAYRLRDDPEALESARAAIEGVADVAEDLHPQTRSELGTVLELLGDPASAQRHFEAALASEPLNVVALAGLSRVFASKGEFVIAGAMERRLAGAQQTDDAKFAKLLDAADTYSVRASNWPLAVEAYEQASSLRPGDHQLLHTLLVGYQKMERWDEVSRTLRKIAGTLDDPASRSKTIFTLAQIARDKLSDPDAALAFFEESLDLDRTRLEAFERIVRLLTERRDWNGLEQAYVRMIGRASGSGDDKLLHALHHQLGLIYRDRLRDPARAIDAFHEATRLAPDDAVDQVILRELLAMGGRVAEAVDVAIEQVQRDPLGGAAYGPLFDLFVRAEALDRAWCIASVMHFLGVPGEAAEQLYRAYGPAPLANVRGQLGERSWPQLLHPDLDPVLTELFEVLGPAVSEGKLAQMSWRERLAYPGSALPTSGPTAWIGHAIGKVSETLSLDVPKAFTRPGVGPAISVGATRPPSLVVSPSTLEAVPSAAQPFILGKRVSELLPPVLIRSLCPSVTELTALCASAGRAVQPRSEAAGAGSAAGDLLRGRLKKMELDRLGDAVSRARTKTLEDVERWSQLADLSTSRAGLLFVSDLELARNALALEGQLPGDLSVREQMRHLVMFAVSDAYATLRQAMGVAIRQPGKGIV
jgi:tetratricopeptide (TPR) repeat protein